MLPAPLYQAGALGSFGVGWEEATGQTVGAVNDDLAEATLADDTAYTVEALFVGFDSATPTPMTFQRLACVYRSGGGFAAHASGSPLAIGDIDGGDPSINATVLVTGADSKIYFRATGKAAITIDWRCWYRLTPHS